jgi:TonB family protein
MKARLIFRLSRSEPIQDFSQHSPRPVALGFSLLLHAALIASAFLVAPLPPTDRPGGIATEVVLNPPKKIIWYPLRDLREIAPAKRIGNFPVPRGIEKRSQTIVSDNPVAKQGQQLLWHSESKKQIEVEVPTPDLIAVAAPREPAKPPKQFQLPDRVPVSNKPLESLPMPAIQTERAQPPATELPRALLGAPKITRAFVPPPIQAPPRKNPDLAINPPSLPAADLRTTAGSGIWDSVFQPSLPQPSRQATPPATGSTNPAAGDINAAVLSTAPADKLPASIPEGSHSARMSVAPTQGPPSSGPVKPGPGLQIPGVAIAAATPPPAVPASKLPPRPGPVIYDETRPAARRSIVAAPLRPSSRVIPQAIESRFHDRVVYTVILFKPQIPVYAGDWVLWFAEKQPKESAASQMRAPMPVRKVEPLEAPESNLTGRLLFTVTILKNGQIDGIAVLGGVVNTTLQAAAIKDLQSWQFTPALRDGQPVDVEAVLEIPFQAPASISSTGTSRY